jgi:hypothetical protein
MSFEYLASVQMCTLAEKPQRRHDLVKLTSNQCTVYCIPFPDNNNLVTYYKIVNM